MQIYVDFVNQLMAVFEPANWKNALKALARVNSEYKMHFCFGFIEVWTILDTKSNCNEVISCPIKYSILPCGKATEIKKWILKIKSHLGVSISRFFSSISRTFFGIASFQDFQNFVRTLLALGYSRKNLQYIYTVTNFPIMVLTFFVTM